MKKKILLISGGISKERLISLDTGKQVAKELSKHGYNVKIVEPDFRLFEVVKYFKPKIIFNALHGQYGEDGYIQIILETIGIPYTHSGVIPSAIAMNKELSKKIFTKNNILTPKHIMYSFDKTVFNLIKLIDKSPLKPSIKFAPFIINKKHKTVKIFKNIIPKNVSSALSSQLFINNKSILVILIDKVLMKITKKIIIKISLTFGVILILISSR